MSLKDRLDEEPVKAEAWRPDTGDELIGKVVRFNVRKMDEGEDYPVVTVEQADGEKLAFHVFHSVAKAQLEEEGLPRVGDEIAVRYLGKVEGKQNAYHNYRIIVDHVGEPGEPSLDEAHEAIERTKANEDDNIPF